MQVGVRREQRAGERRVAATPETVQQITALGLDVVVQSNAGAAAGYGDAAFAAAGASIVSELPPKHSMSYCTSGRSNRRPPRGSGPAPSRSDSPLRRRNCPAVGALAAAGVTSFALELVPRISRAQSMDALSSQSLVSGYRAVLEAALRYPRFFPLYMTAAGTIPPARVLVLGAGVAGLQAIGTAKRLGARVSANDIRAASADEVASMGGTFIHLDLDATPPRGHRRLRP